MVKATTAMTATKITKVGFEPVKVSVGGPTAGIRPGIQSSCKDMREITLELAHNGLVRCSQLVPVVTRQPTRRGGCGAGHCNPQKVSFRCRREVSPAPRGALDGCGLRQAVEAVAARASSTLGKIWKTLSRPVIENTLRMRSCEHTRRMVPLAARTSLRRPTSTPKPVEAMNVTPPRSTTRSVRPDEM